MYKYATYLLSLFTHKIQAKHAMVQVFTFTPLQTLNSDLVLYKLGIPMYVSNCCYK